MHVAELKMIHSATNNCSCWSFKIFHGFYLTTHVL